MKPPSIYVFSLLYFLFVSRGGRRILKFALIPYVALELYCRFKLLGHWVGWTDLYSVISEEAQAIWSWLSDGGKNNSSATGSFVAVIGLAGLYLNIRHNRSTRKRELEVYQAGIAPRLLTRVHKDGAKGRDVFTLFNVGGGPAVDIHFKLEEVVDADPYPKESELRTERHREYIPILEKAGGNHKEFSIPSSSLRREIYIDFTFADTLGRYYRAHQVAGANPGDDVSSGSLVIKQVQSLESMTLREKLLHLFVHETSKALWRVGGFMKANGITSFSQLLIKTGGFIYLYRQAKKEKAGRLADLPNDESD